MMENLPNEMIEMILGRVDNYFRYMLICKSWYNCIISCPKYLYASKFNTLCGKYIRLLGINSVRIMLGHSSWREYGIGIKYDVSGECDKADKLISRYY